MSLPALLLAAIPAFANLTLADAERRAIDVSPAVQIAAASVRQRNDDLRIARNGGVPHLLADYALAPQAGPFNPSTTEQHLISVGAGISIDDILAASPATRSAAGDLLAAERNADAVALQTRENAVRLYFTALQAIAIERMRESELIGARSDRSAAALRERAGDAPQLDVVRADVTLARARADLSRARASTVDAVDALASATGVAPAALADLAPSTLPPTVVPGQEQAVARALAARPEIKSLAATIDARAAGVEVARRGALPSITASGGYEAGVDSGQPVSGPQAAVHLDFPLAPPGSARIDSAQAMVLSVRAQLVDAQRTIALVVASAVRDERAAEAATAATASARDEAQRALRAVELGYREGASSSLDVADARRTYVEASVDAVVAQYEQAQAAALLEVIVP